jgi:hypothetical protein
MKLNINLPYKHNLNAKMTSTRSAIQNLTFMSKVSQKNRETHVSQEIEPRSAPVRLQATENEERSLWDQASAFYGLPEDLADYDEIEIST